MIEFKVRVTPEVWEDIPAVMRFDGKYLWNWDHLIEEAADDLARFLATMTGAPVRWNWEGSLQGHHVEEG